MPHPICYVLYGAAAENSVTGVHRGYWYLGRRGIKLGSVDLTDISRSRRLISRLRICDPIRSIQYTQKLKLAFGAIMFIWRSHQQVGFSVQFFSIRAIAFVPVLSHLFSR